MPSITFHLDLIGFVGSSTINYAELKARLDTAPPGPINVRICSPGGSFSEALAIYRLFRDRGGVTAYIHGMTASAATIIAMGAARVVMAPESVMLIHCTSAFVDIWEQSNAADLLRTISDLDSSRNDLLTFDAVLADLYAARTHRPAAEMATLMKEERWLTASEALQLSLIDEIQGETAAPSPTPSYSARKTAPVSLFNNILKNIKLNQMNSITTQRTAPRSESSSTPNKTLRENEDNGKVINDLSSENKDVSAQETNISLSKATDKVDVGNIVAISAVELKNIQDSLSTLSDLSSCIKALSARLDALEGKDGDTSPAMPTASTDRTALQSSSDSLLRGQEAFARLRGII